MYLFPAVPQHPGQCLPHHRHPIGVCQKDVYHKVENTNHIHRQMKDAVDQCRNTGNVVHICMLPLDSCVTQTAPPGGRALM